MRNSFLLFIGFFIATSFFSCETSVKKEYRSVSKTSLEEKIPEFNADSSWFFVNKQVGFGSRVPNTQPHAECKEFLKEKLTNYGAQVIIQTAEVTIFNGQKLKLSNIIAQFYPERVNRILLLAHWDTRPFSDQDTVDKDKPIDGASDGASGVGVLLEVARHFRKDTIPGNKGIDIIFFDGEDYGQPDESRFRQADDSYCLGAQYWAANPHVGNYHATFGILLDMVGATGATFYKEGNSEQVAPDLLKKIWNKANKLGYSDFFRFESARNITDDHLYIIRKTNIPVIDIIHLDEQTATGFPVWWHTQKDNMEIIDKRTLKAVGQTVLGVLYE
ncbi:MAG: hypothetical protein A3G23_09295 [Bacteroidetes bacterium RIFCSPLOWO2_12_FULL_37_12]|nr:MAG: hypothetical protein A3G23_09295 [Bacteroidetes bacterium RIFCSPLOWO2_12_FULL_37_12]